MKRNDVEHVSDSLLEKIKSFIQSVYTGEDEIAEGQLSIGESFSSIVENKENTDDESDGTTISFKNKIIKVFGMETDVSFDEAEFEEDDDILTDEMCSAYCIDTDELEDLLKEQECTFSDALLALIDEKGLTDPEVYKKANIDRKHFQKIKNPTYRPGKAAAISLGLALELDYDSLQTFIGRADHQLSHAFKTDIVIEYCVNHLIFDVFRVNDILFELNLPMLSTY